MRRLMLATTNSTRAKMATTRSSGNKGSMIAKCHHFVSCLFAEVLMRIVCLTKKADPPPTRDVNPDLSGNSSGNGSWFGGLDRPRLYHGARLGLRCRNVESGTGGSLLPAALRRSAGKREGIFYGPIPRALPGAIIFRPRGAGKWPNVES